MSRLALTHAEMLDEKATPRRFIAPEELTWRQRLMAKLMVHGTVDPHLLAAIERHEYCREPGAKKGEVVQLPPPGPGEPLAAAEAGRLVGIRKRPAEALPNFPIFQRELSFERARKSPVDGEAG